MIFPLSTLLFLVAINRARLWSLFKRLLSWYAVSLDQATDNVKAGCGRPTVDAITIPKSSQDLQNTWKNKWPVSFYHIPNMCRYCWMGRELRWRAARMAQGLASPVMAYLSLSVSISSAPEHSSGLRAVGCRGGGRGSRCHGALGEGRCPVTSSKQSEWERGGSCTDGGKTCRMLAFYLFKYQSQ